jgi:hypothetical protein
MTVSMGDILKVYLEEIMPTINISDPYYYDHTNQVLSGSLVVSIASDDNDFDGADVTVYVEDGEVKIEADMDGWDSVHGEAIPANDPDLKNKLRQEIDGVLSRFGISFTPHGE